MPPKPLLIGISLTLNTTMTITHPYNRTDWFLITHQMKGKHYHGTGRTITEALTQILSKIFQDRYITNKN